MDAITPFNLCNGDDDDDGGGDDGGNSDDNGNDNGDGDDGDDGADGGGGNAEPTDVCVAMEVDTGLDEDADISCTGILEVIAAAFALES
jgi:hypothetical protein